MTLSFYYEYKFACKCHWDPSGILELSRLINEGFSINLLCCVFRWNCEPLLNFMPSSHGNAKNKSRPFLRTKPSVIDSLKQRSEFLPPRKNYEAGVVAAGGIGVVHRTANEGRKILDILAKIFPDHVLTYPNAFKSYEVSSKQKNIPSYLREKIVGKFCVF